MQSLISVADTQLPRPGCDSKEDESTGFISEGDGTQIQFRDGEGLTDEGEKDLSSAEHSSRGCARFEASGDGESEDEYGIECKS